MKHRNYSTFNIKRLVVVTQRQRLSVRQKVDLYVLYIGILCPRVIKKRLGCVFAVVPVVRNVNGFRNLPVASRDEVKAAS
jgi:hypothetical protein